MELRVIVIEIFDDLLPVFEIMYFIDENMCATIFIMSFY